LLKKYDPKQILDKYPPRPGPSHGKIKPDLLLSEISREDLVNIIYKKIRCPKK
jgi:hypothetical protein